MRSQDGALDACKSASVGAVKLHLSHTGGIRNLDCEFYVTVLCDVCGRVLYFFSGSFPVIQYYPTNQSMDLHCRLINSNAEPRSITVELLAIQDQAKVLYCLETR